MTVCVDVSTVYLLSVYGCPDLDSESDDHTWYRRDGSRMEAGCKGPGGATWSMDCNGFEWIGPSLNCSHDGKTWTGRERGFLFGRSAVTSTLWQLRLSVTRGRQIDRRPTDKVFGSNAMKRCFRYSHASWLMQSSCAINAALSQH